MVSFSDPSAVLTFHGLIRVRIGNKELFCSNGCLFSSFLEINLIKSFGHLSLPVSISRLPLSHSFYLSLLHCFPGH